MGGSVHEAMSDLIYLLDHLVDVKGKILVPGVYDSVAPVTDAETLLYNSIDFDVHEYGKDLGVSKLLHENKKDLLMHRWRFPTLSLHGIEGAFSGTGAKTVIPRKVIGKFSIRIVPNQDPEEINRSVVKYLEELHKKRGSPNVCKVLPHEGSKAWVSDFNHEHYVAGRKAVKRVFGVEPDMTREGGSIPVALTFEECTGKNVMLLPMGACDDMAHSQNEKMNRTNYIQGAKLLGAYIMEVGKL